MPSVLLQQKVRQQEGKTGLLRSLKEVKYLLVDERNAVVVGELVRLPKNGVEGLPGPLKGRGTPEEAQPVFDTLQEHNDKHTQALVENTAGYCLVCKQHPDNRGKGLTSVAVLLGEERLGNTSPT